MSTVTGPVTIAGIVTAIATYDPAIRWNGWIAAPGFTREEADKIIAQSAANAADFPDDQRVTWDGDTIVIHDPCYADEEGYTDERVDPDSDGLYGIGAYGWVWEEANEDRLDLHVWAEREAHWLAAKNIPESEIRAAYPEPELSAILRVQQV